MPDKPPPPVDPDAPPTDEERASAEELRRALEDPARAHDDAGLARGLRAAWSPPPIDPDAHHRILAAALARPDRQPAQRPRVVRVAFGAASALALAAGAAAVVQTQANAPVPGQPPAAVAVSRSTQPLFDGRFPSVGGETSRIDRIALARAVDLRDNEFQRWGVR
jgi:hypothetical protein